MLSAMAVAFMLVVVVAVLEAVAVAVAVVGAMMGACECALERRRLLLVTTKAVLVVATDATRQERRMAACEYIMMMRISIYILPLIVEVMGSDGQEPKNIFHCSFLTLMKQRICKRLRCRYYRFLHAVEPTGTRYR